MAQDTEPRPVCASATAEEAKETFPEFLRAPWVPVGAEETSAGGEGAGVGCGLGEDRAEHKDRAPARRGPRNPCCCEPGQPKDAAVSPADILTAEVGQLGSRVLGSERSAAWAATTGAAQQTSPEAVRWRADHIWGARSEVPLQGFAVPRHPSF